MRPRRFGCTSGQNTFRAITRPPVELQSSRSVHLDQRDEIYLHARRELRTDKNTFRAITRLSFELQSSRLVHLDQRDAIYVHARRELHPPKAGCGMDVRSLVLYFVVAPSRLHPKARTKHGWRCKNIDVHPRILVAFQAYLIPALPGASRELSGSSRPPAPYSTRPKAEAVKLTRPEEADENRRS